MIGMNPSEKQTEVISGSYRVKTKRKKIRATNSMPHTLVVRRDLLIAYARLQHKWTIGDLANVFNLSRYQIMRAINAACDFKDHYYLDDDESDE